MSELKKVTTVSPGGAIVHEMMPRVRPVDRGAPVPFRPDSAGITEGAREMARAYAAVEGSRDIRTERVDALRAEIVSGHYQPDARQIAQAILKRGL